MSITGTDKVLEELKAARDSKMLQMVDSCPLSAIREVKEDGTEALIGHINLFRCPWLEWAGSTNANLDRAKDWAEYNETRLAGDPEIVWSVGCKCIEF